MMSEPAKSKQTRPRRSVRRVVVIGFVCLSIVAVMGAVSAVPFSQWRARCALTGRKVGVALHWLAVAEWFDPKNPDTAFLRARAYRKLGEMERVAQQLQHALDLGCPPERVRREQSLALAQSGSLDEVEKQLVDMFVDPRGDEAEICEAYVNGCMRNYRFAEAHKILNLWEADFPGDPQPNFLRARIFEHFSRFDRATSEYLRALEKHPGHAPAAYGLGRVALTQDKPGEALKYYRLCETNMSRKGPARVGIAACLRRLERTDEARRILRQVSRLPPESLAAAFRDVGDKRETSRTAVDAELGRLELAAGNFDNAARLLRKALEGNPRDWQIRYSLATALQRLGETDEAKSEFDRVRNTKAVLGKVDDCLVALMTDPGDVESRYTLGEIYLKYLSEDQGVVWLQSVLHYDVGHVPTHRALAEYYRSRANADPRFAKLAEEHSHLAAEGQDAD